MFTRADRLDYVGPFAGQISGLIKEIKPAAAIVMDMVAEAVDILTCRLPATVKAKA
jgi:nitronate monooxygenase